MKRNLGDGLVLKAHGSKEENQSSEPQGPVVVTCDVGPQEEEMAVSAGLRRGTAQ